MVEPRTHCKGVAEERNNDINVLKIISKIALKARIRKVGGSRSVVYMAN